MQGRAMHQGQPTSNMMFPTESYIGAHAQAYKDVGQAYAKAAEIESQARQKMVGDIAQGALGGFSEYKKGVQAEKNFTAGRSMLESPYFQKMLGMKPEEAGDFGSYLDLIKKDQGVDTANRMMESSLGSIMKYAQVSRQFENELAVQRLRNQGALDVAGMPARSSGRQVVPGTSFQLQDSTVNPD